jgi:NAD-dependent dihydropyrimidine dehydrogenase PreA subunit
MLWRMPTVTVDPLRCEGKKKCVEVCPMGVFAMRPMDPSLSLPLLVRFKVRVHGGKQAKVEKGHLCAGCGMCVEACPEKAIRVDLDGPVAMVDQVAPAP